MASLVKNLQDFFTADPFGRKIEISEFKQLDRSDKEDFVAMLEEIGIESDPLPEYGR